MATASKPIKDVDVERELSMRDIEAEVSTLPLTIAVAKGVILAFANVCATACIGWLAVCTLFVVATRESGNSEASASAVFGVGMIAALPVGVMAAFGYFAYALTDMGNKGVAPFRIKSDVILNLLRRAND